MNIIRALLAKKFRISYSQLAEDIIASEVLCRKPRITYVDIGANNPVFGSNSFYFYLRGGRGICVEPNEAFQAAHRRVRPKDRFVLSAVSDSAAPELFFNNSGSPTDAYASFEEEAENPAHVTRVKNLHINSVLAMASAPRIDFLSLDTETMDAKIIKAIDYARFPISVICVETNKSDQDTAAICGILRENGFSVYASNPINTLFANKALLS
jgi:FkbM family methyltransferase